MMDITGKSPQELCFYARDVLKARWPEAESIIVEDPEWAYWYAVYIIKGRWLEGEEIIMSDPLILRGYLAWIKLEMVFLPKDSYERTLFQLKFREYL